MVRMLSISMVFIIFSLAIISRKNFSKYKDGKDILWYAARFLLKLVPKERILKLRNYIRKSRVLGEKTLDEETEKVVLKILHDVLLGITVLSLLCFLLSFLPEPEISENVIKRPNAGEASDYVDIEIQDETSEKKEIYRVEVHPRQLTEEQFGELYNNAVDYIESVISADNISKDKITDDLMLPDTDETGLLTILWESDSPEIVSSMGQVDPAIINEPVKVGLTATIKDEQNEKQYKTEVQVVGKNSLSSSERAKVAILEIEGRNRTQSELYLPETIEGARVRKNVISREDSFLKLFVIGLLAIGLLGLCKVSRIKESGEERDKLLEDAYYGFVNRLSIYIGAGLTIQDAFRWAIKNESCLALVKEIEYALNQISAGIPERVVYTELGNTLGSQEYMRLMSLISQNLAYGNSNLLKLLDSEVKTSFFIKKEHIRKKGEQASEKLLLPSSILMILVIAIVMYPAFINL